MHVLLKLTLVISLLIYQVQSKAATIITFEGLSDGAALTDQFASSGVSFSNAVSLVAGLSLNEIDFPPHSGSTVIGDNLVNPLEIVFLTPVNGISAWFTYASQVSIQAYNFSGMLVGEITSSGQSNLGANELITIPFSDIGRLDFSLTHTGDFVLDDLTFSPNVISAVPEVPEWLLLTSGTLALAMRKKLLRRSNI